MQPRYSNSDIRALVECDIAGFTGNWEDAETVLQDRFTRDLRRRSDWTYGLDRAGCYTYRAEITRQVEAMLAGATI